MLFQSTLPARGATRLLALARFSMSDFNPRSPHGERPKVAQFNFYGQHFKPRSPHGERRPILTRQRVTPPFQSTLPARGATESSISPSTCHTFQSTLPARGATNQAPGTPGGTEISIHAPRTGSDKTYVCNERDNIDFNPRSPHGERHPCGRIP